MPVYSKFYCLKKNNTIVSKYYVFNHPKIVVFDKMLNT